MKKISFSCNAGCCDGCFDTCICADRQCRRSEDGRFDIRNLRCAADKKSATVVLKDTKSAEEVTIIVNDELTLDKFKDKRIVEGDEIRCKYEKVDGKNISKMFKKTAGC